MREGTLLAAPAGSSGACGVMAGDDDLTGLDKLQPMRRKRSVRMPASLSESVGVSNRASSRTITVHADAYQHAEPEQTARAEIDHQDAPAGRTRRAASGCTSFVDTDAEDGLGPRCRRVPLPRQNSVPVRDEAGRFVGVRMKTAEERARKAEGGGIFKSGAVEVLRRERRLLTTGEITKLALQWRLLGNTGKTPEATMASALYTDVKRKERTSIFIRPVEGLFGLREWEPCTFDLAHRLIELEGPQQSPSPASSVQRSPCAVHPPAAAALQPAAAARWGRPSPGPALQALRGGCTAAAAQPVRPQAPPAAARLASPTPCGARSASGGTNAALPAALASPRSVRGAARPADAPRSGGKRGADETTLPIKKRRRRPSLEGVFVPSSAGGAPADVDASGTALQAPASGRGAARRAQPQRMVLRAREATPECCSDSTHEGSGAANSAAAGSGGKQKSMALLLEAIEEMQRSGTGMEDGRSCVTCVADGRCEEVSSPAPKSRVFAARLTLSVPGPALLQGGPSSHGSDAVTTGIESGATGLPSANSDGEQSIFAPPAAASAAAAEAAGVTRTRDAAWS